MMASRVALHRGFSHALHRGCSHALHRGCNRALSSAAAKTEYAQLAAQLESTKARMHALEQAHPEVRSSHCQSDGFTPPRLHHINIVSHEVSDLLTFYRDVMRMDEMPIEMFPRTPASTAGGGSDVPIRFTTDGAMQMHLATQDLDVAHRSKRTINPIGVGPIGHIAYRTDDIEAFKAHLDACGVAYSDYGTTFAKEWYQI